MAEGLFAGELTDEGIHLWLTFAASEGGQFAAYWQQLVLSSVTIELWPFAGRPECRLSPIHQPPAQFETMELEGVKLSWELVLGRLELHWAASSPVLEQREQCHLSVIEELAETQHRSQSPAQHPPAISFRPIPLARSPRCPP